LYNQHEIELKLHKIIAEQLGVSEDNIVNDSYFIIIEIQDTFGLQIPDEVVERIDIVQDALNYISNQLLPKPTIS